MLDSNIESLDIYKKFEKSEIALHKLQLENAKKNSEILKLKEELQQYKTNVTNTSTSFPWPEEFKSQWESLVKTMIMDSFENISLNTILFMRSINIIIKLIFEISKIKIKEKIIELLKCLNIKNKSDDIIKKFFCKYQKILFQNYFNSLFIINEELIIKIINQIKNEFVSKKYKNLFSKEEINKIIIDLSSNNIHSFIKELYYLCLYMNINIPTLTIKTSLEPSYRYFNKNEYINLEGFANDGDICLIIINPPMVRPNIPFREIKPVVFIIDNPSKEIINLCEEQKIKREQSKSYNTLNNKIVLHKANSNNISNKENIKMNGNKINKENKINKKKSYQIISDTFNNASSNYENTNAKKDNNIFNNSNNDLFNNKKFIKNKNRLNTNKYNSLKIVDIQINEQQKKINNNLLNNEYKSKSSNKDVKNNKIFKQKNKENYNKIKIKEYFKNQKPIQNINQIKNKYLYFQGDKQNINNINNYNDTTNNIINKESERNMSKFSKDIENRQINNYINKIEPYIDSNGNKMNYFNTNNNDLEFHNTFINKEKKILNNIKNYNVNTNYQINSNIVSNKLNNPNNNPLMNSLNEYSNYKQLKMNKNVFNNNNFEKSRNNINLDNKDEFKYNLLNHNIKNQKDRYTVYNKSNNNFNNKVIITTTDYSKQNISNINNSNINTNLNESYLISAKKNTLGQNNSKSFNNSNNFKEKFTHINSMQITDISNNKIINPKYTGEVHQLTDKSINNNMINDKNFAKTTIKKICSNNYHLRRIIGNNNYLNNQNINHNLSAYNKTNLKKQDESNNKNVSPNYKKNEQKQYSNLKYNLSFKKNFDSQSEISCNNNLLYKNNVYNDYSNKNQHRANSNDIKIKRREYITNINKNYFRKEKDVLQNHSNVDIIKLNREFSSSSILSSNSQVQPSINNNYHYRKRDISINNKKNNYYNNKVQLKTEISERTKGSFFNNNKICNNLINNNMVNNIKYSKKKCEHFNNSNRNNIHYTKNKCTKNIASKKLDFQLNYESNLQKQNNIFGKY